MNLRVTQSDVAKEAGVHPTTVSMALRNHPSLPLETRQRLQQLATSMGYRPDPELRALMLYRRQINAGKAATTLAYVTNWGSRWGWKDVPMHAGSFAGATEQAARLGYRLDHFWLGEPGLTAQRMSDILAARGIPGLIFASHRAGAEETPAFDWTRLSAVKIGFAPASLPLPAVTNDHSAIVRLAMRQALTAGYRRIGFVMPGWFDESANQAWSAGYLVEQRRQTLDEQIPILRYRAARAGAADSVPPRLLAEWYGRYRPEVILSWRPLVLPRLAELGIEVPDDVAFIDLMLDRSDGSVAGVGPNYHRVGELAVEILAGQLRQHAVGLPTCPTISLVKGTWTGGATLPQRRAAEALLAVG